MSIMVLLNSIHGMQWFYQDTQYRHFHDESNVYTFCDKVYRGPRSCRYYSRADAESTFGNNSHKFLVSL